ncbi:hypothetical protein GSI_13327 [Ganoderma sinense ZZ0214-1]|uniref:Uncharacterized protein n=1 Tax=Ganoderma sinense ZZ0214-1 TaxID=1077348 RepID=A0A2G8RVA0_9APHY|nr:hypothetical protein GSI_13327 [Ganoderma sinense ZZ0214-1]
MSASKPPLPPPTPEQIQTALDHASKLHYAFAIRPPVDAPSQQKWHRRFKRDLAALVQQLAAAQFSELPVLAIGCVWELNRSHGAGASPFEVESIRPAIGDHPALKGPGQLRYRDGGDGPNGLIAEKDLLSVWWDEFREEAAQAAAATEGHDPTSAEDGESEVGEVGTGTEASVLAPAELPQVPLPTRKLCPRKNVVRQSSKALQGEPSCPAPSATAAGKRTAGGSNAPQRPASQNARGSMTLADITPEDVPNAFIQHPQPCRRCVTKGHFCLINPLFKSTCQTCAKAKTACSIAFDIKLDHILAAYLGFAYHKMLSNPSIFAELNFSPTNYPNLLPTKASIQWFIDQFNAARDPDEPAEGSKADPEPHPQLPVPPAPELPRASQSSRWRSAAPVPQVQDGAKPSRSSSGVRTYSKRGLRSRPGSPESSTLPGTPVSAASPPPRSPSAQSATSYSAPALSGNDSDGSAPPAARRGSRKGKGKAKAQHKQTPKVKPSTTDIPVRPLNRRSSPVMKEEEASVSKESVTISSSILTHGHEDLFDGEMEHSLSLQPEPDTKSEIDAVDYKHDGAMSAVPETDDGKSWPAFEDRSDLDVELFKAGPSRGRLSGLADARSGGLCRVPGTHSLEVLKSIDRVHMHPTPMAPSELALPTMLKSVPAPPSRPQSPIFPLRRDFFVPPINGSWRGLRRVGPRNTNGQYSILPPPDHNALAIVLHADNPERHPTTAAEAPKTLPQSQLTFSIPVYEVAHQTRAKYDAVAAMAVTVEKHSELLSQQSASLLQRHETLYRKVEASRSWNDGVLPLLAHAKSIVKDVKDLVDMLANLHSVVAGIASIFDVVPPVPANWVALMEILETGCRLQDLHRFTWAKLDQFEEDFHPLRCEAATLQVDCDDVRHRLDSILSEVDDLIAPLLRNMARNLSEAIARLETRIGVLDGTTTDSAAPGTSGPRPANLGDVVRSLLSVMEALRELEARVHIIDGGTQVLHDEAAGTAPPLPTIRDVSTMLGALNHRLNTLNGSTDDNPSTPTFHGPRPASMGDIMVAVTQLTERIVALETQTAPMLSAEEVDVHVAKYLSRLGLSEDMLRRLATHFFYTAMPGPSGGSISSAPMHRPPGSQARSKERGGVLTVPRSSQAHRISKWALCLP